MSEEWTEPVVGEAPKVYCPKDKKKVPVWHCLGSFTHQRQPCEYWTGWAEVDISRGYAKVKCSFYEGKT